MCVDRERERESPGNNTRADVYVRGGHGRKVGALVFLFFSVLDGNEILRLVMAV
jgi:hypothetical protein